MVTDMYTNTSCTLFLLSKNYEPVVIPHCFYTSTSIASASRQGLDYQESAECFFRGNEDLKFTKGKDFLIEGSTDITIDCTTQKGISEGIKAIHDAGGLTVMRADYKGYGSKRMRHWEISCK